MKKTIIVNNFQAFIKMHKSALDIYELSVFIYDYRASLYPVEITTLNLGRFSSIEKAQIAILESIIEDPENPDESHQLIHSFEICENGIDGPCPESNYEVRVYGDKGEFYGIQECEWEPFSGKELESNRFKLKDFVEFIIGDHLHVGIIAGLPLSVDMVSRIKSRIQSGCDQSDNTYTVLYGLEDHDHLSECQLFYCFIEQPNFWPLKQEGAPGNPLL